jgi:hypothetical protein
MKAIKRLLILFTALVILFAVNIPSASTQSFRAERITDTQGCTYWITKSSNKRHNSSCRWYKKSKGYCTDEKIGIACKICGG